MASAKSLKAIVAFLKKFSIFLTKLPKYIWVVLFFVVLAESVFWPSIMQLDHMAWNCYWTSDNIDEMWIPELGLTYYQCFIMFFSLAIISFHIPIAVVICLIAWQSYNLWKDFSVYYKQKNLEISMNKYLDRGV